jgi:hypothetical protein
MSLHNVKMELVLPVFLGGLSSLALCALLAVHEPGVQGPSHAVTETANSENVSLEQQPVKVEEPPEEEAFRILTGRPGQERDLIQEMYRQPDIREWVIVFFEEICNSREIAEVILTNADVFNIAPALAFALSWEESRFNPHAVNNKNRDGSIDRGLFQLNNRSFPLIEIQSFFDPTVSACNGMQHFKYCLDAGGSEIAALAMYNAGAGKVTATGAPKHTLDYISRILQNRMNIEARFRVRLQHEMETRTAEKSGADANHAANASLPGEFSEKIAESGQPRYRLVRLSPLAGHRTNW